MTEQERRDRYERAKKRHATAGIEHAKALEAYNFAAIERGEAEADLFRSMTLEELEAQVARTQGRGDGSGGIPQRLFASLWEEAGEVCDYASSEHLADPEAIEERRASLLLELGDVLNVVTAIAMYAGFTLEQVAKANDAKLRERWPDGHPDLKEVK